MLNRSKMNSNNEGCCRTFNPRRVTNESYRLDYILMSEKMVDSAQKLEMSVLPKSLIESDHNLLSLKIIIGKLKPSKNYRKDFFRFPDCGGLGGPSGPQGPMGPMKGAFDPLFPIVLLEVLFWLRYGHLNGCHGSKRIPKGYIWV